MTAIPDSIVQATWPEVASMDLRDARRAMEKLSARQPAMLTYVTAMTEDSGKDAKELATYLTFVIYQMFERLPGHHIKRISIDKMERRAIENEAALLRLSEADDRFIERAAHVQAASQPHVLRFLVETLFEEEDDEMELTEDETGLIFHVLKTVIDVLDNACK